MIDLAIVPVAGHGTRLLPCTKSQPKEMLPVGRKPAVQFIVEELIESGIRRILFITGRGKSSLEDHFQPNKDLTNYLRETGREEELAELGFERSDAEFFYTRQKETLGLGHAILSAWPLVGDQPVVVALGDSIIGRNAESRIVERMVDEFERSKADAIVAFEEVPFEEVHRYGIAECKANSGEVFELTNMIEKPSQSEAPSNLAVAARYVFSSKIFAELQTTKPGKGGEIQLTDAIRSLIQKGGHCLGMRLSAEERRFDIGNFESYFRAFTEFALADPVYGEELRAYVKSLLDSNKEW